MREGDVEETFYPRNPLDVLAQQVVAIASRWTRSASTTSTRSSAARRRSRTCRAARSKAFSTCSRAAIRPTSSRSSGPRIMWDRIGGTVRGREGARRVAVVNAGTIPDRASTASFSPGRGRAERAAASASSTRRWSSSRAPGEVFLLGASSLAHRGDHARPRDRHARAGRAREDAVLARRPPRAAARVRARDRRARARRSPPRAGATRVERLTSEHGLDARAAANLSRYVEEQSEATGEVPSDRTIVVERYLDEMGDWRVCILSPFGARVHAPVGDGGRSRSSRGSATARERRERSGPTTGSCSGCRSPTSRPTVASFFPAPDEVEDLVIRSLGGTSLFAARFRENAARALLLPRRHPGAPQPALGPAQARGRPARCRVALRLLPDPARDVPRVPARRVRPPRPRGPPPPDRDRARSASSPSTRARRRRSRRRSSSRTSRTSSTTATPRSPSAARRRCRSTRRSSASSSARRSCASSSTRARSTSSSARCSGSTDRPVSTRRRTPRPAPPLGDLTEEEIAAARRSRRRPRPAGSTARRASGASSRSRSRASARFAAAEDAARLRDALGVVAAAGPSRRVPRARRRPARRPRLPLRAHARPLPVGGPRGALRPRRRARPYGPRATRGGGPGRRRRVPSGRPHARVVRRRGAAVAQAALAREAPPRSRAGRAAPPSRGSFSSGRASPGRAPGLDALLSVVEQLQGAAIPASVLETRGPSRAARPHTSRRTSTSSAPRGRSSGAELRAARTARRPRRALSCRTGTASSRRRRARAEGELAAKVRELLARRGALFFADLVAETGGFPRELARRALGPRVGRRGRRTTRSRRCARYVRGPAARAAAPAVPRAILPIAPRGARRAARGAGRLLPRRRRARARRARRSAAPP